MADALTCLTDPARMDKYGLGSLSDKFNAEFKQKIDDMQKQLENAANSEQTTDEIMENLAKDLSDYYKKSYVKEAQSRVAIANNTLQIFSKAKSYSKEGDLISKNINKSINALLVGEGSSLMFKKKGRLSKYSSRFRNSLSEKGVLKKFNQAANDPELNEEIVRYIYDRADGMEPKEIDYLKKLTPEEAEAIRSTHHGLQDQIFYDKKHAGLGIGREKNFVTSRRYDVKKLVAMGANNFVTLMEKTVNAAETFAGDLKISQEARAAYFKDLHFQLTSKSGSYTSLSDGDYSAAIMSKLRSRQMVFNKGESFTMFKETSPITDYRTLVHQDMDEASSVVTNYGFFGADAKEVVDGIIENIEKFDQAETIKAGRPSIVLPFAKKRSDNILKSEQLSKAKKDLKHWTTVLTKKPENNISGLGYALQAINNMQVMSKLGATVITTALPTDMVTTLMSVLTDRGALEALKALPDQIRLMTKLYTMKEADLIKFSKSAMIFVDTQNMTYLDRMGGEFAHEMSGEGFGKAMSRTTSQLASTAMKYSGMDFQYKRNFFAGAAQSLITLGGMVNGRFDNAYTAKAFQDLNFSSLEQSLFKKMKVGIDGMSAGEHMLDVSSVYDEKLLPLEAFGSKSSQINRARRDDFVAKITGFTNSRGGQSSPTPSARTALKPGKTVDNWDMLYKVFFLFKNTIFHMTDVTAGQVGKIYDAGGAKGLTSTAALVGSGSLVSYMVSEILASAILDQESKALNFISGKKGSQEDFALDFASKMSLMPIFTDPITQAIRQRNRWGQSGLVDSLTGPTMSMFRDLENIPKTGVPAKSALKFGMNHLLPASNFLLRGAASHGFDFNIRNWKEKKKSEKFQWLDF